MGNIPGSSSSTATPPIIKRKYLNKKNVIKYSEHRILQNFSLIWLDATIDESKKDCQYTISQLRQIVNSITTSINPNDYQRLIEKTKDEQIFLIVSGALGKTFVPLIHHSIRLDSIYVFCGTPSAHQDWAKPWKKIKLITNQIEDICKSLVKDTAQCEHDLTPTSIISLSASSSQDLNEVDQSFMYSQLLKEILLEMSYDEQMLSILVEFCREHFRDNQRELKIIAEFERDYQKHAPIWWYSRECFTYQILNRSLRTVDVDIIAMMGFFMKDIHQQIKQLYVKRFNRMTTFTVYRGQGMFDEEFNDLRNNIGGLFAFNSFLSTSVDYSVAMQFAYQRADQPNKTPVLFNMEVDPTLTSTPFASLNNVSYYNKQEEEILFSMHTIFRIVEVKTKDDKIWEVKLKLVSDSDLQITRLTEQIRREIGAGSATNRLGQLMITLGELKNAECIYELLLESTPKEDEKELARIYNQIGYIKSKQSDHSNAKAFYQKAVEIQEKMRPETYLDLATTYCNIGLLFTNMEDSSQARVFHQKALVIREKLLDKNHPDLATTYNNIGLVCDQLQDYSAALSFYEKTLHIYQKSLTSNHPWLATTYKNIGLAQVSMGERKTGLNNLCKAMEIRKISLPSNHPSIASICSTIGGVYQEMEDYSTAVTFYKEALDVEKRASHPNRYNLAMVYYSMSRVYDGLKQYDTAVEYAELAVQSAGKSLSSDHADFVELKENLKELRKKL
jgi:tetratricopeptide (TPR) repeat protein